MMPKYLEIKKYLMGLILANKGNPDYKLPSEYQLATKFAVSRITSKAALKELELEKVIIRIKGKGSFPNKKSHMVTSGKLIGVIMPDIASSFTSGIVRGLERKLHESGYSMMLGITEYCQEAEQRLLKRYLDHDVAGLLVYLVDNQVYNTDILSLSIKNFPMVFLDRTLKGLNLSCVKSNHIEDAYRATKYLIERGHKKIGILSTERYGTTTIEERIFGYEKALREHNLPIENSLEYCSFDHYEVAWQDKVRQYLEANPKLTAILALSGGIGYEVLYALEALGKKVPEDISVMFYDADQNPIAKLMKRSPTCIRQASEEIGTTAAQMLIDKLNCINPELIRTVYIDTKLTEGHTTRSLIESEE